MTLIVQGPAGAASRNRSVRFGNLTPSMTPSMNPFKDPLPPLSHTPEPLELPSSSPSGPAGSVSHYTKYLYQTAITETFPLTIPEWTTAQRGGGGLERLLALRASEESRSSNAWISLATPAQIEMQWRHLEAFSTTADPASLPLFGVPFAAKDNIDVAGFPTTAACPSFAKGPLEQDSTVVANLKAAGAIVLGKTNLDQFATGLVGTRSPYGAVRNSFDSERVSGGSSSGSAVVVARGIVPFSLGTDTAGSGRVPAGLNNLIGLKPTRGAISTAGVVPACRSLDCVSIFALTTEDAETALVAAEGYDLADSFSRKRPEIFAASGRRMAICSDPQWYGQGEQEAAYIRAIAKAESLGWTLVPRDFSQLFELANLLYEGPWVGERYAAIKDFIEAHEEDMDPTVRTIVLKARGFNAADLFAAEYRRQDLTRDIERAFGEFDAILVPTAPTFPTIEDLEKEPIKENAILGTYTNFVNFLDWSALSVPAGFRADGLPFGITLISTMWQEPKLMALAREWLSTAPRPLGATKAEILEPVKDVINETTIAVVVVGAHLTGFPLNKDLTCRGAVFDRATKTSSNYQLFSLDTDSPIKKPGLKRVREGGSSIEVEVWNLPRSELASFVKTIATPLGIGSVELEDGNWAHSFICEPYGLEGATDITSFGGWRGFMASQKPQTAGSKRLAREIKTVLIANRGEIAVRIIKTLRKLGVSETYLDGQQILILAKESGAEAIIPGYGFLAENADFASQVEAAGLVWIGPTPDQMRKLGLKHLAREVAISAGVPVVPGSKSLLESVDQALAEAERIKYPVMLKSTAGGGGIGLSRCDDAKSLTEAYHSVQRLAEANFGDAGMFVEHFIENARHIEVQMLGDGEGNVTTAGERDCSLQRRNQKVVEESPAVFVPPAVRDRMREAAKRLAAAVKYRNVGTIEYIYDVDTEEFYFLEVNTRLQVEHPVTESVTGLDLVEAMVKIASGNSHDLFLNREQGFVVNGNSIEVRVYAESPLQNFRPSPGRLVDVVLPKNVRVDTWVEAGMDVSSSYDPMIAKIIVVADDRASALEKMALALAETTITGVETNLGYLRQIIGSDLFRSGGFTTSSLNSFKVEASVIEVVEAGSQTAVQDFPGRKKFWHIGVPPSGPFDDYSFRLANRIVGNDSRAAGLEMTVQGPSLLFHSDAIVAITGAEVEVKIDREVAKTNIALFVRRGQTLAFGNAINGYRMYLAIRGGVDVPEVFGSRSTFALGQLGGHNGRNLRSGDLLPLGQATATDALVSVVPAPQPPIPVQPDAIWKVAVVPGPHGAPDFFTAEGLDTLFEEEWSVHYNSNRFGIRLTGPKPQWARRTGGGAGLHPSNIHDTPYSVGSVSFTGDEAVILTCDGPSLGGFVVFCVVASSEMWKLGQMRPGDRVRFQAISAEEALTRDAALEQAITELASVPEYGIPALNGHGAPHQNLKPLLGDIGSGGPGISPQTMLVALRIHENASTPSSLPSRSFRLPLVFDDSVSQAAIARYAATIRDKAPWLPSNVDFLQQLNALPSRDAVSDILIEASFLVLGLGDVFLGSPCTVPLDPRHRLTGTKYNPSRSFTPCGAVGFGGNYMCIYGMDSPGGYQLVGRTIPIWDEVLATSTRSNGSAVKKPWMFRLFDRISFYHISEAELDAAVREGRTSTLVHVEPGTIELETYEAWLASNKTELDAVVTAREAAFHNAPFLEELLRPYEAPEGEKRALGGEDVDGERVRAQMPGKCWRCVVKEGDEVEVGDALVWIESNKMEIKISSPVKGRVTRVFVEEGEIVGPHDDLLVISAV
ncbi:urea amidolyase [Verticillium alfalfae VaMs.102]|uniref:Urea amidolyase n=1 Tax=Verticillium alfalfae (strain VaMs.102 / ATCC MYA-4576 / FGSC 10136) TaxID=526221 RepID=C9SKE6_VERA1|nr:urea amidolyase [Verticillium alfalfae VaMs.102]EEY19164.1 urea amidolyase [Verticillium alfalfae VaMs.102]